MKSLIAILLLATFSSASLAASALRIPLLANDTMTMKDLNKRYKLSGATAFPETITVTNSRFSYENAEKLIQSLNDKIDAFNADHGTGFYINTGSAPGRTNVGKSVTCYVGDALETIAIINGLASTLYTEQLGLWGWKTKGISQYDTDIREGFVSNDELYSFLSRKSYEWKNWDTMSDSLLIVFHVTDDGDDVNSAVIPVCR